MSSTIRRMTAALVALGGLFMSVYLLLHAVGAYGELACGGSGSCDYVQASEYARFLGLPVPGWGVAWYGAVFLTAMLSLQGRFAGAKWPGRALLILAVGGLAFSVYLTAIEAFVLHAFCRWCVGSAILTVLIFLCALPWRNSASRSRAPEALEGGSVT
jgi:uncharacterized membrane protein